MTSTLLQNLRLLDPFGENEFIENASILIENGIIKMVSNENLPAKGFSGTKIDLQGQTVLPGMINAHTHLYSSLALGMPPPQHPPRNFVEILKEIWWKLDLSLDPDSTRASFEVGLLDCLRNGVTTIIDHHASPAFINGSLDILAETAEKIGVNISICFEISDRNGDINFHHALDENLNAMMKYRHHPHIHALLGMHASFTLSDPSLRAIRDRLQDLTDWGIHIHVAEDLADEKDAKARGYESVIQRLDHFGLLTKNAWIIHGIFLNSIDRLTLIERGCQFVHNPTSNANNQVGLLESESIGLLNAGLGTDGMQNNMLTEAKEGGLIRSSKKSSQVNYLELLFKNNPIMASHLFGMQLGHLSVGSHADLVFYDYHPRTTIHAHNSQSHILYGLGQPSAVMTRGIFRLKNNTFMDLDEERILHNSRIQSTKLWEAMLKGAR